ncbi:MAG: nucleoside hydrolase [Mycobacterium sp.]|uniref:nucleoside hydrolase n=1 Tax=Mycobacterium sp. TaxID=1785 RepID=UPI001ED11492|nr:nucleoside hydrolase [Mycobacterium sp.]MBW0016287.1 nucleoside hydrolase [Mycobacterium sp.]
MSAVFVDVDTGIDDAMALIYLLASADAQVVGIASTGGNIAVEQVCANNLGLLELCRAADIPVAKGADEPLSGRWHNHAKYHGPNGLGYAKLPATRRQLTRYDAATAWLHAAHAHAGELIGLVTGPLTNLALALRAEPALPTLLGRLVIMGGVFDSQVSSVAEWNIRVDPEAAAEVFAAWTGQQQLPIVCGLDLTRRVAMTPEILGKLASGCPSPSPLLRVVEDAMRFYFESHEYRGHGYMAYMHDPLAAAVALDPQLVTTRLATVDVGPTDGMTTADWSGSREPNSQIGVEVDSAVFFDRFVERVAAFARGLALSRRA